jgi:hypothetical protein
MAPVCSIETKRDEYQITKTTCFNANPSTALNNMDRQYCHTTGLLNSENEFLGKIILTNHLTV